MKTFTILSIIFWLTTSIFGQTSYFVANNGNDKNSGTSADSPWKTINKVNDTKFSPGDKILFKSGHVFKDALTISSNGTPGNHIVFGKYGGETLPTIGSISLKNTHITVEIYADFITIQELSVQAGSSTKGGYGIAIFGNNNLITKNVVKGGPTSQKNVAGIVIPGGNHNYNIISKNEVMTFGNGIIGYDCLYTTIEENIVHDIWRQDASKAYGGLGIRLISDKFPEAWFDFKHTSVIRNNEVYDFERYAIDCATGSNAIIEYNLIHHCLPASYGGTYDHGTGIKASERNNVTLQGSVGNVVRYNIIRDLRGSKGIEANYGITTVNSEDGWIYGNLIYNIDGVGIGRNGLKLNEDTSNWSWKIFNNTIISEKECIWIWADAESPTYIQNNILVSNGQNSIHAEQNIYEGNNIFKNHSKQNAVFQKYRTYTSIGNSYYNTDPKLNGDFTLTSNSPAINNGVSLNITVAKNPYHDMNGIIINNKPDIGAFEFKADNSSESSSGELKVILEGNYNGIEMQSSFIQSSVFPNEHPYKVSPWNLDDNSYYHANNQSIVDWIIVELRSTETKVDYTKAALLTRNGVVINPDGNQVSFNNIKSGNYFVAIRHRNHLDIMSSNKIEVLSGSPIDYNFTDNQSKAYGNNPMVLLPDGKYAMCAGDADGNNVVNNLDFGSVANGIFRKGYYNSDLDMNTIVNVLDYNKVSKNILKNSQIP